MTTFYDLSATLPGGKPYPFSQLKGKVVLIVNVASQCGFTPQYKGVCDRFIVNQVVLTPVEGLQALYEKYHEKGLEILGFPCNQFGGQEPGTDDEIATFCERNHGVTFPLMVKSDVNGDQSNEVYKWLKERKAGLLGLTRIKILYWRLKKFVKPLIRARFSPPNNTACPTDNPAFSASYRSYFRNIRLRKAGWAIRRWFGAPCFSTARHSYGHEPAQSEPISFGRPSSIPPALSERNAQRVISESHVTGRKSPANSSGRALDLDLNVHGAPNFRAPRVGGLNVFGAAQPRTQASDSGEGAILPTWTAVDTGNVKTSRELWETMKGQGWNVDCRIPISPDRPIEVRPLPSLF
ncbi:glutathione peroxidase [Salix suchowensis]|nr:glutathione peroxidase [Salix suchowensis]